MISATASPLAEVEDALARCADYAAAPLPDGARCAALRDVAEELLSRVDEIARLLVEEVGKPVTLARGEVERSTEILRTSASEWETMVTDVVPTATAEGAGDHLVFTRRVPVGVVCAITPFNFPVGLTMHKLAPALAAGNACIVKPSEYAPRSVKALAEVFTACGFPAGSVEVVPGGPEIVDALLASSVPGLYSFTGSARVGRKIKAESGLRPVVLELGSNAATIVHSDADLSRAASALARGAFAFAGQACFSVQRILVQREVAGPLIELLLAEMAALMVGAPDDPATVVGPLISKAAALRVEQIIRDAVAEGAHLLTGGTRSGQYIEPALLTNVAHRSELWHEEVFGPVALVEAYEDLEQAFELANQSRYGLQSGFFTSSLANALDGLDALEAGAVLVNEASSWRCTPMPFGGVRESGIGREGPRWALETMTLLKTAVIAR